MYSRLGRIVLAAVALLALAAALPAQAATIGPANYQDLQILIQSMPASVTITADNQYIYLTNSDNTTEAVVVFYPQFTVVVHGLDGAFIGVWNGSAVVVRSSTTKFDVVYQFGGGEVFNSTDSKMGAGALALIIPPLGTARIAFIEYDVATQELSAPSPPSGYQTVSSKTGTGTQSWQVSLPGSGSLWIAWRECSATACDYDLYIYANGNKLATLYGMDTQWETRTLQVSATVLDVTVHDYRGGGQQWTVLLAFKSSASSPTPVPTPTPTQTPSTENPSSSFPGLTNNTMTYLAVGAGILVVVIIVALALARR